MKGVVFFFFMAWLLTTFALCRVEEQASGKPPEPQATPAVQQRLAAVKERLQAKQLPAALQAAEAALDEARTARDLVGEALAQRERATVLQGLERAEEALTAWREAAAAWARVGDGPGQVEALATTGFLLWDGQPAEADTLLAQALEIGRAESKRPLAAAAMLHKVGVSYDQRRLLGPSRQLFEASLSLRERLAPNSLAVAASLNSLGVVANRQGNLSAAADYYRRALAIQEQLAPNPLGVATILNNLGNVTREQGDLAAAADYHRRALAIREQKAPNSRAVAASLNNLGGVAYQQGDLAAAADYYRRALAIYEKQAPNSLAVAASLTGLGLVTRQQGDLAAAANYFRRALAIKEQQAPNSLEVATSLNGLGVVAEKQGDLAAAANYFRRALAIWEQQAPNSLAMVASLNNLGLVAEKQGNRTEAERLARQAWALVRQQAAAVSGDEARQAFGASTANYAAHLLRYQLALGKTGSAFTTLEEGRAQALQQLLLERSLIARTTDNHLWAAYQAAVAARDRAEQAASKASITEALARRELAAQQEERAAPNLIAKAQVALQVAGKKFEEAQGAYTQARVKADQLWADIKKNAPRAFAPPLTLEQAQKALPATTLLVEFSVDDEQTHVFLLRAGADAPSSLSVHTVTVTRSELEKQVRTLREQLINPDSALRDLVTVSRALFAQLFPKEAQTAVAQAQRLLISPDGPLWELPFAALIINPQGAPKYLGADKPMSYTQSAALFSQSRQDAPQLVKGQKINAVVLGNPIFDRQASASAVAASLPLRPRRERHYLFDQGTPPLPLPGTRTEARRIAELYSSIPLTGADATEAALRSRLPTADVIHLATHGYFHPARAMSSGVLLTVPEKEPEAGDTNDDGVLQAWEIQSQLKLRAELVVLSACEMGRGHVLGGEGLIGMTRALQYAGARSIIASQWRADDQQTPALMVALHRYLRQGLAKDEALRQAMTVVHQGEGTEHPYYWAGFFLTGDPDNPNLGK